MKMRNEIYKILAEWGVLDANNINDRQNPELAGKDWESDKIVDPISDVLCSFLPTGTVYGSDEQNVLSTSLFDSNEKYKQQCVEQNGDLRLEMKKIAKESSSYNDEIKHSDIRYKQKTIVESAEKVNKLIQNIHTCFENADGAKDANFEDLIKILCMEFEVSRDLFPHLTDKKAKDYYIDRLQNWAELAEKMGAIKDQNDLSKFNFKNIAKEIDELEKAKSGGAMGE